MMAGTNAVYVARWESPWGLYYLDGRWGRHENECRGIMMLSFFLYVLYMELS